MRIYPDQVHVDAHDPRLTPAEVAAGQEFWVADWRSGERRRAARAGLAGAGRAARPGSRSLGGAGDAARECRRAAGPGRRDGDPPLVEPIFGVTEMAERAATPVARLLPGAWTATAYAGGQIVAMATGRPISLDPAVGPDIDAPLVDPASEDDENSEVAAIDQGMNWLVDFAAAEAIGMALRLPVSGPVDLLLVSVSAPGTGPTPVPRAWPRCSTPSASPPGSASSPPGRRRTTPATLRPVGRARRSGSSARRRGRCRRAGDHSRIAPRARSASATRT